MNDNIPARPDSKGSHKNQDILSAKSVWYICVTITLIFLFHSIQSITIEFIKSSNPTEVRVEQPIDPMEQLKREMFKHFMPDPPQQEPRMPRNPEYNL